MGKCEWLLSFTVERWTLLTILIFLTCDYFDMILSFDTRNMTIYIIRSDHQISLPCPKFHFWLPWDYICEFRDEFKKIKSITFLCAELRNILIRVWLCRFIKSFNESEWKYCLGFYNLIKCHKITSILNTRSYPTHFNFILAPFVIQQVLLYQF